MGQNIMRKYIYKSEIARLIMLQLAIILHRALKAPIRSIPEIGRNLRLEHKLENVYTSIQ